MVETILNVDQQITLLRLETSKEQSQLKIPEFIKVVREVTQDDNYASSCIAKVGWTMPLEDRKALKD